MNKRVFKIGMVVGSIALIAASVNAQSMASNINTFEIAGERGVTVPSGNNEKLKPNILLAKPRLLSGKWRGYGFLVRGDSSGCIASDIDIARSVDGKPITSGTGWEVTWKQQGNRFGSSQNYSYSGGGYTLITEGFISGNQVKIFISGGGFRRTFTGNLSQDGRTISGNVTCEFSGGSNKATRSATFKREGQ